MSEKFIGTVIFIAVFVLAIIAMRKAGDSLRDLLKASKK